MSKYGAAFLVVLAHPVFCSAPTNLSATEPLDTTPVAIPRIDVQHDANHDGD